MEQSDRYKHNYPSCSRTYAALCIYHESADPQIITDRLQLKPDETVTVGDLIRPGKTATKSIWFLRTKDILQSRDFRAHIDWLLDKVSAKKKELQRLFDAGYEIKISCFWASASGNGGPYLDHEFIKRLSEFPIELDFDIWFDSQQEEEQ
jgi:hypothetical protein